jgi:hypothetical protein
MKRSFWVAVIAAPLLVSCGNSSSEQNLINNNPDIHQPRVFRVRVTAAPGLISPLGDQEADDILRNVSNSLQRPADPEDVPCPVTLVRDGPVAPLPIGVPSIVVTGRDMDAVLRPTPGEQRAVRVLVSIGWCSVPGRTIVGCAYIPGSILSVVRHFTHQEPYLWAHEFGHNRGLNHDSDDTRIMAARLTESSRRLSSEQCAAFVGPEPASLDQPRLPMPATAPEISSDLTIMGLVDALTDREFLPETILGRFSPNQVLSILPILRDEGQVSRWRTVVQIAGILGDHRTTPFLIDFLLDPNRRVTSDVMMRALAEVPRAMGNLAHPRLGNDIRSLQFLLRASAAPGYWAPVAARAPDLDSRINFERFLGLNTLAGLSASGRLQAQSRIDQLQAQLRANDRSPIPQALGAAGTDALARESELLDHFSQQIRRSRTGSIE